MVGPTQGVIPVVSAHIVALGHQVGKLCEEMTLGAG